MTVLAGDRGGVDRSVETINRGRVAKLRKHVAVPAGQVSLVQLQVRQLGLIERGHVLGRPIERLATAHAVIRGGLVQQAFVLTEVGDVRAAVDLVRDARPVC